MDLRKRKKDAAGRVLRIRVWDARLATLPTSYAHLARAARSLDGIGVASMRPRQSSADHEPDVGRDPGPYIGVVA